MRQHRLLAAAAVLQLAGCTGMDQAECRFSDWRAVGYEDGAQGLSTDAFARYRRGCAEQQVMADFQAYQSGREAGLREYCQPSRGYRDGLQGRAYGGVCPSDTEARFLDAYNEGRKLFDLQYELDHTEQRIVAAEARLRQIELQLTDNATATLTGATTREARARLIVEAKQLVEERSTLNRELKDLKAKRRQQQKRLDDARDEKVAKR